MPDEWGGYTLLDEAMKLKMAGQNQGYVGGTPTLTGSPATGTAIPAIPPELMTGPAKPEATFSEKLMKGVQDYAPLMSQFGTTLMQGRNAVTGAPTPTVGSQLGSIISGALISQKMNEATKKMIAAQLAGKGGVGGGTGFNEGQPGGFTGGEVAGLSPEQISGLYGAGLGLRAQELKRPFDELNVISDAYMKVMSGEAKPAEMEAHLATAQKARQDFFDAPYKTMAELFTKIKGLEKADAEIDEIKARTTAIPTETAKKEAETTKTVAETKKTTAETTKLGLEMNPEYTALKKRMETEYGTKLEEIRRGDQVTLTNPITGKPVLSYTIEATPETATKTKAEELPIKKFAMQRIAPLVVPRLEAELAAMPGGKQKIDLQNLISSLRGYTGEIDPGVLLAKSSPELQDKFNKLMDIYIKTPGLSETEFGNIVQGMVGKGAVPSVSAEKPTTGKPTTEKYKPGTTTAPPTAEQVTKQLTGKKPGTYESNNWTVEWDGTKIISTKPKKATSELTHNYGTF